MLFPKNNTNLLSVYFTAGYPRPNTTVEIINALINNGVDMIEIGIPFSDPLADGPVIQHSATQAIKQGMTLKKLFDELKTLPATNIPLLMMGYLNSVMQYGLEKFCKDCYDCHISGVILPDLPLDVYKNEVQHLFKKYNLLPVFLITPATTEDRIREIDAIEAAFIYMVASAATTGKNIANDTQQQQYFERISAMQLKHPTMVGFGISNQQQFDFACRYANGAIIGSAFIKALADSEDVAATVKEFVKQVSGE